VYDDDSLLSLVQSDFALKFTRIDHGLADEARLIGPTANDRPGPGQWEESRRQRLSYLAAQDAGFVPSGCGARHGVARSQTSCRGNAAHFIGFDRVELKKQENLTDTNRRTCGLASRERS